MKPIYFTLDNGALLMVIPDTEAHIDGHPVITYSYSIYRDEKNSLNPTRIKENNLHLEKKDDPDYLGTIVFKIPGRSLDYITDGQDKLTPHEIRELVDRLNELRETPALWKVLFNSYLHGLLF